MPDGNPSVLCVSVSCDMQSTRDRAWRRLALRKWVEVGVHVDRVALPGPRAVGERHAA